VAKLNSIEIDKPLKDCKFTVEVKVKKQARLRVEIAKQLMNAAALILGCKADDIDLKLERKENG